MAGGEFLLDGMRADMENRGRSEDQGNLDHGATT